MMKKALFVLGMMVFAAAALTAETGYEIMKKSDDVPAAKTSSFTASMTLVDKKGQKRVREVKEMAKDFGDVKKTVIVFVTPKDVAGVGYLMWDYEEDASGNKKDTDSWLYMPAMKKVRRISGSGTGDDFMGTDFTYEDMGSRGLNKDTFTLLGEDAVDGVMCYKVEAVAKDTTEKNPRRIFWISKENYMMYKAEFYDRQNNLQRELTCSKIELIDGFWTTGNMLMKNVQTKHSTVIEMKNVTYGGDFDDNIFTVTNLQKGRIK